LNAQTTWAGDSDRSRRIDGAEISTRIVSPKRRIDSEVLVAAGSSFR
jgi:hypothetical protein